MDYLVEYEEGATFQVRRAWPSRVEAHGLGFQEAVEKARTLAKAAGARACVVIPERKAPGSALATMSVHWVIYTPVGYSGAPS